MVRVPPELARRDPERLAETAGLRYVEADEPGYGRRRRGRGFSYLDGDTVVRPPERDRLAALAVPPAWSDVWFCRNDDGHLQATGFDDAGRKQYRYHDRFRAARDRQKFDRLRYFSRTLLPVRRQVAIWLEADAGTRNNAIGAVLRLLDVGLLRIGNRESADDGHHGATTLLADHLSTVDSENGSDDAANDGADSGYVQLDYVAKSGKARTVLIEDDELAEVLVRLADHDRRSLFWFRDDDGSEREVTAVDVNRALAAIVGPAFTAKDFRLWGGTRLALEARVEGATALEAVDHSAGELGNTRAVARSSYIHPQVLETSDADIDAIWRRSRRSTWRSRSDSALDKLLNERRRAE